MKNHVLVLSFVLTSYIATSWSIVKFADEEIHEDFKPLIQQYELVRSLYNHLSSSEFTYIIRYNEINKMIDGHLFTNGESLYITLKKREGFPVEATFVHEAVHALQFESGRIAFYKNKGGEWKSDNVDLWDEAEAFVIMLMVIKKTYKNIADLKHNSNFMWNLYKKYELYGIEEVVDWLTKYYPGLPQNEKHNPAFGTGILEGGQYFYLPYRSDINLLNEYLTEQQ